MSDLGRAATRGILWAYLSRYSGKALVFVSTIVLARLLVQEDFGVAGYALVVIALLETLSGLGVGPALIYHEDSERARNTGFLLGLGASLAMFAVAWVGAPLIAQFFQDARATAVTRVLALSLPLSALGNVHFALLEKHLEFGRKVVPDLANSLVKGFAAILFAVADFGAWSLILGQLLGTVASVAAVWIVKPWRPGLRFDPAIARSLLSFGLRIIAVGLLGFLVANLGNFAVGRALGPAMLGVYVLALRIPEVLIKDSALIVNKVLFPVFVRMREDTAAMASGYVGVMRYLALIIIPLGIGLAAVAEPFVIALLSQKWVALIPVLRLTALYTLLLSLAFNAGTVFKAMGRPGLIIRLSVLRLILLAPILWWAIAGPGTLEAVVWAHLLSVLVHLVISFAVVGRLLGLPLGALFGSLVPAVTTAALMYGAVELVLYALASRGALLQLACGVLAGVVVYVSVFWIWQRELLLQGIATLRNATRRQA